MKISIKSLGIAVVVAAFIIGLWFMGMYNGFASQAQAIDAQWAQVETQYQRRYDLIPNLVESTKGVLKQEQTVFENIAQARSQYAGAQTAEDKAIATNQVESALSRLLVVMENYPQLNSNQTVQDLMTELAGTENRIAVERKRYNDEVRLFNTALARLPARLVAPSFGFNPRSYFTAETAAAATPKVDLSVEK